MLNDGPALLRLSRRRVNIFSATAAQAAISHDANPFLLFSLPLGGAKLHNSAFSPRMASSIACAVNAPKRVSITAIETSDKRLLILMMVPYSSPAACRETVA